MTTLAERIVYKMNVLPFNSNEYNETGDIYPTEQDYVDTIGYNLVHGWRPDPKYFTEEEIEYIKSL
jgi:hypothetical protein